MLVACACLAVRLGVMLTSRLYKYHSLTAMPLFASCLLPEYIAVLPLGLSRLSAASTGAQGLSRSPLRRTGSAAQHSLAGQQQPPTAWTTPTASQHHPTAQTAAPAPQGQAHQRLLLQLPSQRAGAAVVMVVLREWVLTPQQAAP